MHSRVYNIYFDSYIKPQPVLDFAHVGIVVYLLIPTSNHNATVMINKKLAVVYLLIPTSNHNGETFNQISPLLYIF